MSIYAKKQSWKIVLFIAAIFIVGVSLWYTNLLVKKIAREERNKVKLWADAIQKKANLVTYTNELFNKIKAEERKRIEIWANATKMLSVTETNADLNFYLDVVKSNNTIPVILLDDRGEITSWLNFDSVKTSRKDSLTEYEKEYLQQQLSTMQFHQNVIEIDVLVTKKNYLYYTDSKLFSQIKNVLDDLIRSFISEVVINSAAAPVIFTNSKKDSILASGSIDTNLLKTEKSVTSLISEMSIQNTPIEVELFDCTHLILMFPHFLQCKPQELTKRFHQLITHIKSKIQFQFVFQYKFGCFYFLTLKRLFIVDYQVAAKLL